MQMFESCSEILCDQIDIGVCLCLHVHSGMFVLSAHSGVYLITLTSLKGTKSWSLTLKGTFLFLCVRECVLQCGIQLSLSSISLKELGLWEIMILITHKLKGSRLSVVLYILPGFFSPSFSHFSMTSLVSVFLHLPLPFTVLIALVST